MCAAPQPLALSQREPQRGAMIVARSVRMVIPVVSAAPFFRIISFYYDFSTLRPTEAGVNRGLAVVASRSHWLRRARSEKRGVSERSAHEANIFQKIHFSHLRTACFQRGNVERDNNNHKKCGQAKGRLFPLNLRNKRRA